MLEICTQVLRKISQCALNCRVSFPALKAHFKKRKKEKNLKIYSWPPFPQNLHICLIASTFKLHLESWPFFHPLSSATWSRPTSFLPRLFKKPLSGLLFFFYCCSLSFVVIMIPRLSCLKSEWNRVLSQHRALQKLPSQGGVILWTHCSITLVKIVTTCTWLINPFHLMFFLLPSSLACPWHTHNSFVILGSLKRTRLCFVQSLLYLCPYSTSFFP